MDGLTYLYMGYVRYMGYLLYVYRWTYSLIYGIYGIFALYGWTYLLKYGIYGILALYGQTYSIKYMENIRIMGYMGYWLYMDGLTQLDMGYMGYWVYMDSP